MARRQNKKQEDYLAYPYTPDRQLETPSGWCMTDYHDGCPQQFNHGKCGCDCHSAPAPEKKRGRPKKETLTIDNDPRPWKRDNE